MRTLRVLGPADRDALFWPPIDIAKCRPTLEQIVCFARHQSGLSWYREQRRLSRIGSRPPGKDRPEHSICTDSDGFDRTAILGGEARTFDALIERRVNLGSGRTNALRANAGNGPAVADGSVSADSRAPRTGHMIIRLTM